MSDIFPFVFELKNACEDNNCTTNKLFKMHLNPNDASYSRNVLYFLPAYCQCHYHDFKRIFQVAFCNELVIQYFHLEVVDANTFYLNVDTMSFGELKITKVENLLTQSPKIVIDRFTKSPAGLKIKCKNNVKQIEFSEIDYTNRDTKRTITIHVHQYLEELYGNIEIPKIMKRCNLRKYPEFRYLINGSNYTALKLDLRPVPNYTTKKIRLDSTDAFRNFHTTYDPWTYYFKFGSFIEP